MRSRLTLAVAIAAVIAGVAVYVVRTTDHPVAVQVGSAARDAFTRQGTLTPSTRRALFSPDGTRLALVTSAGIGIARGGDVDLLTETDTAAVDAAWMPNSKSLLIGEGPADIDRLTALDLDGNVTGVAHLDAPFSLGTGNGMTVDRRGGRAVVASETRDAIGGRRHLDLVLVDLTNGKTTRLTDTPDVDEAWPVFVDDNTVYFSQRQTGGPETVAALDLASGSRRRITPDGEEGAPVGIIRSATPVYASGRPERSVGIWAETAPGERVKLGSVPAGSRVWSVDPAGTRAVAATVTTVNGDERVTLFRAVTLQPPDAG